jgi:penicillin-binding protein 1A
LLDLTSAYAPFANGGMLAPPYIVASVRNGDGKILYAHKRENQTQVIAQAYLGPMNDMMNATIVYGTGKQAALPDHVAGGKTGTSQQSRDAWFVGYTAHYVAGVWVGNDDGSKMKNVTGGTVPARLWHDIMNYAHRGKPIMALPGTRMPKLEQADAKVPWAGSTSQPEPETPFFDRVFGVLGGG